MVKLRKFSAYQRLERPYNRVSKFSAENFVRGGYPNIKVTKFNMGNTKKKFDCTLKLNVSRSMNIRHNALEAARMSSNRLLEKSVGSNYHLLLKVYPFHILRENPLAAGAGADRMSTGMQKAFGKTIGVAARLRAGQTLFQLGIDKANVKVGREAMERAIKKLPCSCKIVVE